MATPSLNRVMLIGHTGQNAETKTIGQSAKKIVLFNLATNETWTDRSDGTHRTKTFWHRVVVKNDVLAELASKLVTKGSRLYVEGALEPRDYQDASGNTKTVWEIVLGPYNSKLLLLASKEERLERESAR